ncbi:MAG: hypothetical protein NXH82_06060 [Rhodobacteraceae bacterium]|nr:hypothetical protein [Paracoccaceae bacterium]
MLIFSPQSLAFLAVPKTGSTAIEMALRPRADIVFARMRKHTTAQRFHGQIAPFLDAAYGLRPERIAVMREPEEQIRSWYRYRRRTEKRGSAKSSKGLSFDDFVQLVISDDPHPVAGIGSQFSFLTSPEGKVLVHRLFAYEDQPALTGFLEARFETSLEIPLRNVSPPVPADLDPAIRRRLRAARSAEFALYDRLRDAGGVLCQSPG